MRSRAPRNESTQTWWLPLLFDKCCCSCLTSLVTAGAPWRDGDRAGSDHYAQHRPEPDRRPRPRWAHGGVAATRSMIGDQGTTMENFIGPTRSVVRCVPHGCVASTVTTPRSSTTPPPNGGFQRFLELGHEDATPAPRCKGPVIARRYGQIPQRLSRPRRPDAHRGRGRHYWWVPTTTAPTAATLQSRNDNGTLGDARSQPQHDITDVIAGKATGFITTTTTTHPDRPSSCSCGHVLRRRPLRRRAPRRVALPRCAGARDRRTSTSST